MDVIHTCTAEEGELGQPSRKIELFGVDHQLLAAAYFLGGIHCTDDDGNDLPERSSVCLILTATADPRHPLDLAAVDEHYQLGGLRTFGEAEDPATLNEWEVYLPTLGLSDAEVDAKIAEVLRWHNEEIRRIASLISARNVHHN
jgi:hypothetical protein